MADNPKIELIMALLRELGVDICTPASALSAIDAEMGAITAGCLSGDHPQSACDIPYVLHDLECLRAAIAAALPPDVCPDAVSYEFRGGESETLTFHLKRPVNGVSAAGSAASVPCFGTPPLLHAQGPAPTRYFAQRIERKG